MKRRALVALVGPLLVLPGCVGGVPDGSTVTEVEASATSERGTTEEPESVTPPEESETTADECGWPQMCEGSTIVRVEVSPDFSGQVVLEADCRDGDREIEPGETETIERAVDAESCAVRLYVDRRTVYDERIPDYQTTRLRVGSNGAVQVEITEL